MGSPQRIDVREGYRRGGGRVYKLLGDHRKVVYMKVLRGHMSSGSVIYVVDAVWRIKSEQDIISNI